jgi:hypothetical protein
VTLAAVGTAIVFGIEKGSAQSSANSEASLILANKGVAGGNGNAGSCYNPAGTIYAAPCSILSNDNSNVNTDALIGNIALGVGIAGAAFTVLYWAFAWKGDASATASAQPIVTPLVGKGTGGLSLGASF